MFHFNLPFNPVKSGTFTPEVPIAEHIREETRSRCTDPQCGDSTWEHMCNVGERLGTYQCQVAQDVWVPIQPGDFIVVGPKGHRLVIPRDWGI